MISKITSDIEAYVWVWLPNEVKPVIAGRILKDADQYLFNYGKSYLLRENAISLNAWELPLQEGFIAPLSELTLAGCLRDCAPGEWGRRVVLNYLSNAEEQVGNNDELLFLLNSGSNRIGAIDFQRSATQYYPKVNNSTTLEALLTSVERLENKIPLTQALDKALIFGTSIGGIRPKAHITDNDKQYIAKFSARSDTYAVVKLEYVAMRLAAEVGLYVAPVQLLKVANEDVLLVERFDRIHNPHGWQRKNILSALTLFELDNKLERYASYADLADIIRTDFSYPDHTQQELFKRLIFNILIGNTDDHARNHAAFWDGKQLHLTPAFDICPQLSVEHEPSQSMLIAGDQNQSRLDICVQSATLFGLETNAALQIIEHQIKIIKAKWDLVCDEANLQHKYRQEMWGKQIFNPFSIDGYEQLIHS